MGEETWRMGLVCIGCGSSVVGGVNYRGVGRFGVGVGGNCYGLGALTGSWAVW